MLGLVVPSVSYAVCLPYEMASILKPDIKGDKQCWFLEGLVVFILFCSFGCFIEEYLSEEKENWRALIPFPHLCQSISAFDTFTYEVHIVKRA